MYYNKYLKYKKKYLQLKNQLGGDPFCEKVYNNRSGTCWAVAIQTLLTFGQATSDALREKITTINSDRNLLIEINKETSKTPERACSSRKIVSNS